tara:strand:+ start:898 stop:1119 length:222 start_codon:yes stop_codon:yes gene_type:complete
MADVYQNLKCVEPKWINHTRLIIPKFFGTAIVNNRKLLSPLMIIVNPEGIENIGRGLFDIVEDPKGGGFKAIH